jgi:glycosyltransferase involved in cell wall biosynthesis
MSVFVLDAESTDETVRVAADSGARVEGRAWTGFLDARRYALARVDTPWAFMLDADEALDEPLASALLEAPENVDAYVVRRTTWFCGRPIRRWTGEPLLRVFRIDRARLEQNPETGGTGDVHERWIVDGPVGELAGTLNHYSYPTVETYRRKFAEYTTLEALGLQTSPLRLGFVAVRAVVRFCGHVLLRGMLLDGWRGLYLGFWSEAYPIVAHWKALRLR